jgi:hypothetical protein
MQREYDGVAAAQGRQKAHIEIAAMQVVQMQDVYFIGREFCECPGGGIAVRLEAAVSIQEPHRACSYVCHSVDRAFGNGLHSLPAGASPADHEARPMAGISVGTVQLARHDRRSATALIRVHLNYRERVAGHAESPLAGIALKARTPMITS